MTQPTPEQLAKLPKWAQEHIRVSDMRLREAKEDLDALRQNKESPFYYQPDISSGPKVFVPAYSIICEYKGVVVEISPRQSGNGISLQWSAGGHNEAAFIPRSWQQAEIISKENMR